MIEVNSIDAGPGEVEILTLAANYVAGRLFTARQQKSLMILIDVTRQAVRAPVTRAMLAPQKSVLSSKRPNFFEMTVSTTASIRDAAEVIAHELMHISQAINGRLVISAKTKKINRRRQTIESARWMGGKPVVIDELAWHNRPWEVEACHWQTILVNEFLQMSMGQPVDQPVQKPKKQQLALYSVVVPIAAAPVPQEPAFSADTRPVLDDTLAANGSAIDAHFGAGGPNDASADALAAEASDIEALANGMNALPDILPGEMPLGDMSDDTLDDDDALMSQLAADLAAQPAAQDFGGFDDAAGQIGAHDSFEDMPFNVEMPVPPVIDVAVPGLDVPRQLEREAMDRKLMELRSRGLAGSHSVESVQTADIETRV